MQGIVAVYKDKNEMFPSVSNTYSAYANSIMKYSVVVIAICCFITAQARPGYHGWEKEQLQSVPDISSYQKLEYPKFELQELGSESHGEVPPKTIKIIKTIRIKIPEPYPVKVPQHVPYPVPVAKPYPVVETKLVHVPHPVPIEVIKKVPVPIEVPKPYPVPKQEYLEHHTHSGTGGDSGVGSFGNSFGGSFQATSGYGANTNNVHHNFVPSYGASAQSSGADGGYNTHESNQEGYEGHSYGEQENVQGQADQSVRYAALAQINSEYHEYNGGGTENENDGQQQ